MRRETPLLPARDAREAALFFVIAALCFLAALAGLTAKSTYGAAKLWTDSVQGELTVRLKNTDRRGADEARDIVLDLSGVEMARVLTRAEIEELLAPTFAGGALPSGLPMPLVMAIEARGDATDIARGIEVALSENGMEGVVDAHSDWAGDVRRSLSVIRAAALTAVILLAATALAVIAFATHAALLARRDIVDVLHLSGATDRFISKLFERRFWMLGIRAGSVGALAALGGVALLLYLASANAGRTGLLPQLSLDAYDVVLLLSTPVVAALAARIAARLTVMRALQSVN